MSTTVLAHLRNHRKKQLASMAQIEAQRDRLIRQCAQGREVDPADVLEVCDALAIEPEDFQSSIELKEKRFEAADVLAEAKEKHLRAVTIEAQITQADEKYGAQLKALHAEHTERKENLNSELWQCLNHQTQAIAAENLLRDSFADPAVLKREKLLIERSRALQPIRQAAELQLLAGGHDDTGFPTIANQAGAAAQTLAEVTARPDQHSAINIDNAKRAAAQHARHLAAAQKKLADVLASNAEINQELTKLSALRLAP